MSLSSKEKVVVGVLIGIVVLSVSQSKNSAYSPQENYESSNQYEDQNANDAYYEDEEPVYDEQNADTEESDEASQKEGKKEEETQEEKPSVYEVMAETGFPTDRLDTVYQDVNDAVNIVMANGTSGIHKLEFVVSDDNTQIIGIFSNGTEEESWAPACIIDANTLRMYYEDNTMDFRWVVNCGRPELEITATGNMISTLVDEFAGRTLN